MNVREIWNALDAVLVSKGFPVADVDDVPQGRRCSIQITGVPSEQPLRGAISSGRVRLIWEFQIVLMYDTGSDRRIEKKIAEDAETVIHAIYTSVNLSNHHFISAVIERDPNRGLVTDTIRFDFQAEAAG
jgi:hypothetical protein